MRQFSEATAHVIDQEVQRFIHEASIRATEILSGNRDKLDQLALALLEREALNQEEMTAILGERATAGHEVPAASGNV
jgi:ATP-dependent Zn protease